MSLHRSEGTSLTVNCVFQITFPRETAESGEGRTREHLKADEVLVKGGRKGVAGAKSELMDVSISPTSSPYTSIEMKTNFVPPF